ncbi:MAG TPA: hypothetical protein IAB35_01850 [Candidatus Faecimonas gallistercoris]|nr:hypothetical protein [Candidatus Faecimonas gallistercoris]
MGVFDKIKNALFEEEYVEVEEKPRVKPKPRKEKVKKENRESSKKHDNKPIAKKVVLPNKKEEHEEELDDYKPRDEDFEIVPEREKQVNTSEFKFPAVDDQEFKEESYYSEPKIVEVVEKESIKVEEEPVLYQGTKKESELYQGVKKESDLYHGNRETNLYHSDYSNSIPMHEYGTYDKKDTKTVFKPSPIISPIYGILDKNYKKEEIVPKREVHISSYTREHMSVDDVRRKAYGNLADDIAADIDGTNNPSVDEDENNNIETDNLLVDLSNDEEKPKVSEVTVGDAEEYFKDLGLEYNIDYKDSSKEKATGRRVTEDYNEEEKVASATANTTNDLADKSNDPTTDDNLFDLIDSMYEEENKE